MSLISDARYVQTFSSLTNSPAHDTVPQYTRNSEDTRPRNLQASALPSSSRAAPVNTLKKPVVRSRTLSQPFSNVPGANARLRESGVPNDSARPSDARPTRIPKVSRPTLPSSPPTNHVNGFGQLVSHVSGSVNGVHPDPLTSREHTIPSLSSLGGLSRQVSGILDEPPPFPTGSVSSVAKSQHNQQLDDVPPRLSTDSEERPFEHWYRGEISRNGGVGELRVVRRQEMLDIATYGHTIAKRQIEATMRTTTMATTDDGRWRRKRAGSVGEIGRPDRDSLYMDEEHMDHMGRVLDEDPPTDLDNESDAQSTRDHLASSTRQGSSLSSSHQIGDPSVASEPPLHSSQDSSSSSRTLTASNNPSTNRQNGTSRIPSPPRRSTEARPTTPVQNVKSTPSAPSTPRARRQQAKEAPTPSAHKRAVSPTSSVKKPKPNAAKNTRSKVKAKKETSAEDKRRSVATYPLSKGEGDMAYAIPTWTQPKQREGNWDEASDLLLFTDLPIDLIQRLYYPSLQGKKVWTTNMSRLMVVPSRRGL